MKSYSNLPKMKVIDHFALFFAVIVFLFFISLAQASENEKIIILNNPEQIKSNSISNEEAFKRTQAVLNFFQVSPEEDPADYFTDLKNTKTFSEIQQVLKWMDPSNFFKNLATLTETNLSVYQDIGSKAVLDFSLPVQTSVNASTTPLYPLTGLKIALDPGHMGDHFWDQQTGKFVHDGNGHMISEGTLNLETCLLLKAELEKLGAIVFLTRDDLKPVSSADYATFDIRPYEKKELRDSIHADWFHNLLVTAPVGPELFKNFQNSAYVKKIFSESSRSDYFIKREDLWARSDLINNFQPDIVLVIHYDTADSASNPSGLNAKAPKQTKAFVFGGYEKTEFGSSESRKYFVRHLLDKTSWDQSINLSRSLVNELHTQLGLDLSHSSDTGSIEIEPGVSARNLMVSRHIKTSAAVSYLECLFYNRPEEFKMLTAGGHTMQIAGKDVVYSDRLQQIVGAIKDGVVHYVQKISLQN